MRSYLVVAFVSLMSSVTSSVALAQEPTEKVVTLSRQGFGTRVEMMVFTSDEPGAKAAIESGFVELERLEALLSEWRPTSDISRINKNAGKGPVKVSPDTLALLTRGKEISALTGGAFALSWAALKGLWDFSAGVKGARKVPSREEAKARAALIDDTKIQIDIAASTVTLPAGMQIGVGAIAEGYALDKLRALLAQKGFTNTLVFIGGDIVVSGAKGKKPWVVGIQDPRGPDFFATVTVKDEAVTSSGDYEKFFELDGVRHSHILDPRTGFPIQAMRGVTVVTPDPVLADALATALMVLGAKTGMKLVESLPNVQAVFVDAENNLGVTTGIQARLRIVRPPTR